MTQKPEGICQDQFWDIIEFWLLIGLGIIAGGAAFLLAPVGALLGGVILPVGVALIVWLLGHYLIRLPYTFLLVGAIFVGMILWSWWQTPFVGDSLFVDDLWMAPGYSASAAATSTDYWKGRVLYTEGWEQPIRILITDEGVCLDAKGVQWDGTPVAIYSSAEGKVEVQNTCRHSVAGVVEVRDARAK